MPSRSGVVLASNVRSNLDVSRHCALVRGERFRGSILRPGQVDLLGEHQGDRCTEAG
jgi:hypothetical protein